MLCGFVYYRDSHFRKSRSFFVYGYICYRVIYFRDLFQKNAFVVCYLCILL